MEAHVNVTQLHHTHAVLMLDGVEAQMRIANVQDALTTEAS